MKINILILLVFVNLPSVSAQLLSKNVIDCRFGIIDLSASMLANTSNNNSKMSFYSEANYTFPLSKVFALQSGLGAGNYSNLGVEFPAYRSSDFFRFKTSLMLNFNNGVFFLKKGFTRLQPYGVVGYNMERISQNKLVGYRLWGSSMRVGGGLFVAFSEEHALFYEYTLNQKLGQDYRTFNQHMFGFTVAINTEDKKKK